MPGIIKWIDIKVQEQQQSSYSVTDFVETDDAVCSAAIIYKKSVT